MPDVRRVGRYEVLEHLASGGMGEVHLARSSGLAGFERHVVLKMLTVDDHDDELVAMFLDEARVVGRMHHQHIAPAYELDRDDDGRYFLVMDYVHGQTVKAVLRRSLELGQMLPLDFTVTVVAAAASALHYAHTLRSRDGEPLEIVHRDISPSNLMVGYDGAIKVIDFGIAKAAQRTSQTQVGTVKGKIAYMAPEQLDGDPIDRRTDIFALGIVLYELATMRRAFREVSADATVDRIRRGHVVPPSRIVPEFPHELHAIINRALAVDPAARFQDAEAMRRALEAFGRSRKLVVGDAAVIGLMEQLFPAREEPWQPIVASIEDIATRPVVVPAAAPAEVHDAPTAKLPDSFDELMTVPAAMPLELSLVDLIPIEPPPPPPPATDPLPSWSHTAVLPSQPRLSPVTWLLPIALVAIGVAVIETISMRESKTEVALPPLPAAPVRAPIVTPLPLPADPAPAEPATLEIRITTTPDDATVLLDGEWLGHTPFTGTVPKAAGPHVIKIRRRGCVPKRLDVELQADIVEDLALQPLTTP